MGGSACGDTPPPGTAGFPPEAGHRRACDATTERENNTVEHQALVFSAQGHDSLDGGPAWRRRGDSGAGDRLRADETGIHRVAAKSDLDEEPRPDKERRWVLKLPLAAGTEWQARTTACVLERRQEFPREFRHGHAPVVMPYRIEATGQTLAPRARAYQDFLKVQGRAAPRLFAAPVSGWRDLPLASTGCHCKDVSPARLQREESAAASFPSGGTVTLELSAWQ